MSKYRWFPWIMGTTWNLKWCVRVSNLGTTVNIFPLVPWMTLIYFEGYRLNACTFHTTTFVGEFSFHKKRGLRLMYFTNNFCWRYIPRAPSLQHLETLQMVVMDTNTFWHVFSPWGVPKKVKVHLGRSQWSDTNIWWHLCLKCWWTQPNTIAVHDKKLKAQPQIKQGENKEVKFMRPDKDINIVMSNKDISISIWMKTPLNLKRCDQMYFISLKWILHQAVLQYI